MKQHTILLVACLMTIPAVAAEGPEPCHSGSCASSASDPSTAPIMGSSGPGGCQLVTYWYQTSQVPSHPPVGAHLNTGCITTR